VQKSTLNIRSRDSGPALLAALERLLQFPQHQDSTDPKLHAAIRQARLLVGRIRGPPKA
jgi:hypothetical protein